MARFLAFLRWVRANAVVLLWSLLAIGAAVLTAWVALAKKREDRLPDGGEVAPIPVPSFQDTAREKIEIAETEARIEAELAKVSADHERDQLEAIKSVPNDAERRKQLANWLDGNL